MKKISLGNGVLEVPEIGLGCMRITGLGSVKAVRELIDTVMDHGINFFDHADIYTKGGNVNVHNDAGTVRDGGILEYCRLRGTTIQAWSPFQCRSVGAELGVFDQTAHDSDTIQHFRFLLNILLCGYPFSSAKEKAGLKDR